jgi:class 3 adenylate cyclase/tetratricopeptide (TPR) repeat protein
MQQIADWLNKLGMSEYAERFAENRIDLSVLRDLTDQDLKDLGVVLGDRRKMLRAIGELAGAAPAQLATAAVPAPQETAERRQLTVMFCDLVGSTALSASLDPEDLRGIIGAYHRCSTEVIERNGGFVAKYMGDGVLAYFGYPQAHEHDAERAVRAGLNLVEAVPKLKTVAAVPLQVRIGIATGLVVVGDLIGAGAAQEQAVVGETPNLAARLQAFAEPGAVVIASSTRKLIGGLFEYRDLGSVALKGFAESVPAWQVLGASAAEGRFEALRGTTTPLIGRDEEIHLLLRRWDQAKAGDGQVVLICGEPGIGKSRIAQTVAERISAEPHTRLRYFCSPHHQDSTLYPSIAQLERAAGFRREDSADQRLDKLQAVLAQGTNDLSEAVPLLADLLSIPTGNRYPPLNLTPQKRKERTFHAQLAQVEGLAACQPVLMVWEDVHWSDPTTRESLDLLIDRVPTLRVLVILTFRPEFTPPWIGRPHVTMLTLNRLPRRQRVVMIAHVAGGKALPKEITDQIVDRTDGVPLFIEELTKTVLESEIVSEASDHYAVKGPIAPLAIPTTLHASLLARFDRLAPTREVAQIGAAIGRQFSHEMISAVAAMPQPKINDALAQLVNSELIFRRGTPPDAEYMFKHALVQDAAYSTLLRSRRQQLHARIVTTLESQFPEIVATQPQLMARHCAEAGLNEKAVGYWLRAGQRALARSAMVEAATQLRKGLDLIRNLPNSTEHELQELELHLTLGSVLTATQGYAASEAGEHFAEARRLCERLGRPSQFASRVLIGQFEYYLLRAELALASRNVDETLDLAAAYNDPFARSGGLVMRGAVCFWLGDFAAARACSDQAIEEYDPELLSIEVTGLAFHPQTIPLIYSCLSLLHLGRLDQARSRRDELISLSRGLAHTNNLAIALWGALAHDIDVQVEPALLLPHAEELEALSAEHGFSFWEAVANAYRGWCLSMLGQTDEGLALQGKATDAYRAIGGVLNLQKYLMMLAEGYSKASRADEGLRQLEEAATIVEATQQRWAEAEMYRLRGMLLLSIREHAAAENSFHQALGVARRHSSKLWELRAAISLARLWRDQGKRTEARDLLAPIYDWFTEGFNTPVLQDAKTLLDQLT